ncbi:glycosyltransferase family 4 protein [Chitinasiproducens palmae]|uniref:Glycosyltransferase involved in cell wall bisynthesis n=1 Tax=Chitinasiproducens palmae TaxID=1770053 RepID=A0A1H2PNN9_9BURK|nr:glycosyltransferase family 4 protein [Chitinasiproducens palmae]SDV47812.1 Glycosyltransferase involved in cell wall bisynthesis [Chitinasiproducens palmae]
MKSLSGQPVCLVSNTAWSIYNYRRRLLHRLLDGGWPVVVIAPRDATFPALEALGCVCVDLPLASKGTRVKEDLRTLLALRAHYRRLRPRLIFHYTIKPNIYGTLAAALAGRPSVAVTTGLGYVFLHRNRTAQIAKTLYRLAFRFPREVWFLNRDDHETFLREKLLAHPERARLLDGEGIDLEHFGYSEMPSAPPFTFVLIGRLLWDKGVGEYVEAARQLRARYPHARFQLLGPAGVDNPSAISSAQVAAWADEGVIEYLGQADDVRPAIAAAHCVVLPSYREGMPRTLLEAAAMGRPIVATDVPGCRDIVRDGVTGLLCAARDASALAAAMARLLDMTPVERTALAQRARDDATRRFDENRVVARYLTLLNDTTGAAAPLPTTHPETKQD